MPQTTAESTIQDGSLASLIYTTWAAASTMIMTICFDAIAVMPTNQQLFYIIRSLIYIPIAGFAFTAILWLILLSVGAAFLGLLCAVAAIYEAVVSAVQAVRQGGNHGHR